MRYRYVLLTDYPAPWREKVYEKVHAHFGDDFHVVYCTVKESRRQWKFPLGRHKSTFLPTWTLRNGDKERYFSPSVATWLLRHRPEVLIGFSLYPTVLLAFLEAKLLGIRTGVFADTWLGRDRDIGHAQKVLRRIVYRRCGGVFIGASLQTLEMFRHYRPELSGDDLYLSSLCADNDFFTGEQSGLPETKRFDVVFSGRISKEKNPLFFAEVAAGLKRRRGSCRALVIGDGDSALRSSMFQRLEAGGVEYEWPGFVEYRKLPALYPQGRVLLFPTSGDCWGVVANEAMVSGLPVITTQWTAAAGELVRDGVNGYVLPLEADRWVSAAAELLEDGEMLRQLSESARDAVAEFTFDRAAVGIIEALERISR
jgi:glycosyltransferase involved in cell wall biosynthesis